MTEHPAITSRQNPRVKRAVRLRHHRGRKRQRRFLIDGQRELERAIEAGITIDEVFIDPACSASGALDAIETKLRERGTEIVPVAPHVFAHLAFGNRAEGIVAVAAIPERSLRDLALSTRPLVAVIEGAEKPGNVGAVLRSADSAGLDAVVLADGRTDLFNPAVVRASLGTLFRLPVCEATAAETRRWLETQGLVIVTASPEAVRLYTEIDYRQATAIVLGSEAEGLSSHWQQPGGSAVRLPQRGIADSLNLSVAAAVIFYEALRQRSLPFEPPGRM